MLPPDRPSRGAPLRTARASSLAAGFILLLAACSTDEAANQPARVACVATGITAWLVEHYAGDASTIGDLPPIVFADQGALRTLIGGQAARSILVLGAYGGGTITLWDGNRLDRFESQSTLAHELIHWIDEVEGRRPDHRRVYEVQHAWEEAHWPDGVPC